MRDEEGRWHRVARLDRSDATSDAKSAYASIDDVGHGLLTGVATQRESFWWVKLNNVDDVRSRDIFETWRMVLIWASRIMPSFLSTFKAKDIVPVLAFRMSAESFPDGYDLASGPEIRGSDIDSSIDVTVDAATRSIRFHLKHNWFVGFYRPDNYAERTLAAKLLAGVSEIFKIQRTSAELEELVLKAVGSTDFRHRHAFLAERTIDQLTASGLTAEFSGIPVSAGALARCGSVWAVHPREQGVRIEGREACLSLVDTFVSHCESTLISDIRPYDRNTFVVKALAGMQAAMANERHWRRSARALRAIHGVERDFEISLQHVLESNGVLRANTMLCEIAAIEATPENGRPLGKMDLEELQARALQLFQAADTYPAFFTDRIEPTIHLSPTGDILFQHDFHETTIEQTSKLRHARERSDSADEYIERFQSRPQRTRPDDKLTEAIEAEYGVPEETFSEFTFAIVTVAQHLRQGVLVLRRSELIKCLREIDHVSKLDFAPLIDRLTMPIRKNWHDIPLGCETRDFDLAKFDRRFSPIGRPIIALTEDEDSLLAVAPGVIERSLVHNLAGAMHGTLQNEFWTSPKMRSFAGSSGARVGIEFNQTVAERLSEHGLRATPSVKPSACLNERKSDELRRLGDIDVLAVSRDGAAVWVIEAKDLKLCRTLGEVAQRLSEYRGHLHKGKPDLLLRHLRRVDYLRARAEQLGHRLGLQKAPHIHGLVVVNSPQPMQQLKGEYSLDSTVVTLEDIELVPWTAGW